MSEWLLRGTALSVIVALAGCQRPETLEYIPISVSTLELVRSEAPAWSSMIHDLNGDGAEELVLAGHRGAYRAGFCSLDGSVPCRWQPFLERGRDRHHCTASDIDTDGDVDIYCTAGANRGAGLGPNEVWLQVEPMIFQDVPDALGASESSSRGRRAVFFDFDHDPWPDLLTTAYGSRGDGADNRSKLWINLAGRFQTFDWELPDDFGARCLTASDVDGDSYVDLLGCPAKQGLVLLRNHRASELETIFIGDTSEWYWDTQVLKSSLHSPARIISSVGIAEDMFLEILDLTPSWRVQQRRKISCWQRAIDDSRDLYCGRLLVHDADQDGHTDILVSRRKGFRHERVLGDAPDLIIFGPSFQEFTALPSTAFGASERLLASKNGIVQVNAGENWPGSVNLLQLAFKSETHEQ